MNQNQKNEALIEASSSGVLEQVRGWLEQGADLKAKGGLAFRQAARSGHLPVVQYLLGQGADLHVQRDTALYWASDMGHFSVVQYLVAQGADLEAGFAATRNRGKPHILRWLEDVQRSRAEALLLKAMNSPLLPVTSPRSRM